MRYVMIVSMVCLASSWVFGQDKGVFKTPGNSYYQETIVPSIEKYEKGKNTPPARFSVDLKGEKLPTNPDKYTKVWHVDPISQGKTGTCWCFSTLSFYESEVKRQTGREVKLSEMYVVYWEYVERAKYFVKNRGNMELGQGSEANAVSRMIEKYGIVPRATYEGKARDQEFFSHDEMFKEIRSYLKVVKETFAWDEERVVATVRSILNYHMGVPPKIFKYNSIDYSPQTFRDQVTKIKPSEYVNFMSLMEHPYNENAEYDVPDNWWNSDDYMNVSLDDFMNIVQTSIEKGYGVAIGGDVSEIGLDRDLQVGVIPSFDIPSKSIDENARQFRFTNGSTTDDHAMHIVGIQKVKGVNWYLVKDSGSGSRNCGPECKSFGYYFFHEDYIKLKIMNITVHQDAVNGVVNLN